MDLGTTNTYLYLGSMEEDNMFSQDSLPEPVILEPQSDRHGSIATSILYEDGKPVAIGNLAESEFHTHPGKREKRFLASQFKPEIAKSDSLAQGWMRDFLIGLKTCFPEGFLDGEIKVYVGIPSLAREDFSLNLSRCFQEAGWPKPEFVRESDAAVVSCLESGVLEIGDMASKCLILDFGGGTCDYTAIEGLETLQNGGDILYGGRLFDDLIFQQFLASDKLLRENIFQSPVAWYVHWVECRRQKEDFSDFLNRVINAPEKGQLRASYTMRLNWLDASYARKDSWLKYDQEKFLVDSENYQSTPDLHEMLIQYAARGGLSRSDYDLIDQKQIGLISWLRQILESVDKKSAVRKIVLTGGSSRWYFTRQLCERIFPGAICLHSKRGYEDIAFGLALFPVLLASRKRAELLLKRNLPLFTQKSVALVRELVERQTAEIVVQSASHIVERDILPALENASSKTVGQLEEQIRDNIINDAALLELASHKSEILNRRIQEELGGAFRQWIKENGVPLAPRVEFPGKAIGNDFFARASACLSSLDLVRLTRLALTAILPLIVGGTAAHFLAPIGEPVSITTGIGLTGMAAWLMAKTAPQFVERMKIPSFLLSDRNRIKIVDKISGFIRKELQKQFETVQKEVSAEVEKRLATSLEDMVNSLSILNQIRTSKS